MAETAALISTLTSVAYPKDQMAETAASSNALNSTRQSKDGMAELAASINTSNSAAQPKAGAGRGRPVVNSIALCEIMSSRHFPIIYPPGNLPKLSTDFESHNTIDDHSTNGKPRLWGILFRQKAIAKSDSPFSYGGDVEAGVVCVRTMNTIQGENGKKKQISVIITQQISNRTTRSTNTSLSQNCRIIHSCHDL
jgi:hypothetical protein